MLKERASGLLLHISSLPSKYGIGDFGPSAYKFCDILKECGQSYWQILPLNPTLTVLGNSPYNSISAFALNTLFISPEELLSEGLLTMEEVEKSYVEENSRVDYELVTKNKEALLRVAFERFLQRLNKEEFEKFSYENRFWLEDYALFVVLKKLNGGRTWNSWSEEYKLRDRIAIDKFYSQFYKEIEFEKFKQFIAIKQWKKLKEYCNRSNVKIIGDIPIYVNYDSVDVWTNPEIFKLNTDRTPQAVAGVPPDYFSKTGQLWGNPVYDWEVLKNSGFEWWLNRITYNFELFDLIRIDHFRGFIAYWEVPYGEKTAVNGRWVKVPYKEFFNRLLGKYPELPIIAEDLGFITEDVRQVLKEYSLPGMKVLQFAFGDHNPHNPFLPHNHEPNYIVYTGTHDNNTTKGWFEEEVDVKTKAFMEKYVGRKIVDGEEAVEVLITLAMMSVSRLCIIPVQDLLKLNSDARMNTPSKTTGNWEWKLKEGEFSQETKEELKALTYIYGRKNTL